MNIKTFLIFLILLSFPHITSADVPSILNEEELKEMALEEEEQSNEVAPPDLIDPRIFDQKVMIEGYAENFSKFSKEVIMEMIKDDKLEDTQMAAAVRAFNEEYVEEVVSREKAIMEKILLRRMARTNSPFVQLEIMYGLCKLDRYRYFVTMVPLLIQKLNHYNPSVNELAYQCLNKITKTSNSRVREARIIFVTLRKLLFLERRRLATVREPKPNLQHKLALVRWSIKVLGNDMLRKLPPEVINLL